jgi:prolyl oligopeptidase
VLRVGADGAACPAPDLLEHVKFSCLAWTHDGRGFLYNKCVCWRVPPGGGRCVRAAGPAAGSLVNPRHAHARPLPRTRTPPPPPRRYPEAKAADLGTETDTNQNQQLCYHVMGTPQSQDVVVYSDPEHPLWMFSAEVTDDGRCAAWGPRGALLLGRRTPASSGAAEGMHSCAHGTHTHTHQRAPLHARYMIMYVSEGCRPQNQLYYLDLQEIPRGDTGALDFSSFDALKGGWAVGGGHGLSWRHGDGWCAPRKQPLVAGLLRCTPAPAPTPTPPPPPPPHTHTQTRDKQAASPCR